MKIITTNEFSFELKVVVLYIAKDSINKAKEFKNTLYLELKNLDFMPYRNRESIYYDDEDIRDMIFKGYVIIYKIDNSKNSIFVLNIIKNRVYCHIFRKTSSSKMFFSGVPLPVISRYLSHSDLATTQRYYLRGANFEEVKQYHRTLDYSSLVNRK